MNVYELKRVRNAQAFIKAALLLMDQSKTRHLNHRERNHVDFSVSMLLASANEEFDVIAQPFATNDDVSDIPF